MRHGYSKVSGLPTLFQNYMQVGLGPRAFAQLRDKLTGEAGGGGRSGNGVVKSPYKLPGSRTCGGHGFSKLSWLPMLIQGHVQ